MSNDVTPEQALANGKRLFQQKGIIPLVEPEYALVKHLKRPTTNIHQADKGTSGLNDDTLISYPESDVIEYLKSLNFNQYVSEYYDCEDRAFWGMAHARRIFPGIPIGIVKGTAEYTDPKSHAIIIMWFEGGARSVLFDPLPTRQQPIDELSNDGFHDIDYIMAFPIGFEKQSAHRLGGLSSLKGRYIVLDDLRLIYPEETGDPNKPGIVDYIKGGLYKKAGPFKCIHDHKTRYPQNLLNEWGDEDRALWDFVHVRRYYPGCAVGVAVGRGSPGYSSAVLVIWDRDGNPRYWDPHKDETKRGWIDITSFNPDFMFV